MAIDLHVHSTKSDGTLTPKELVSLADKINLSAFALTDHDTTEGLDEAMKYTSQTGVKLIPGIEFSTEYSGRDIHILGLFINHRESDFLKRLNDFRDSRLLRNEKMCKKLREEGGIDITYELLKAENPDSVITRSHYATFLYKHGYVNSRNEAFDRYIGDHCKYFVPRQKVTPAQAIKLVRDNGGVSVLAHPTLYHMTKKQIRELVMDLKASGLEGIEGIYSTYSASEENYIQSLAREFSLLISGGSDFHGDAKPSLELGTGYGKLHIDDSILEPFYEYMENRHRL